MKTLVGSYVIKGKILFFPFWKHGLGPYCENGLVLQVKLNAEKKAGRTIGTVQADVWWHISATRYEIAIMIILENYRDKTNFPGYSIEKAKCFMIKTSRYF